MFKQESKITGVLFLTAQSGNTWHKERSARTSGDSAHGDCWERQPSRTFCGDGSGPSCAVRTAATGHTWLPSSGSVARVTEQLGLYFHWISTKVKQWHFPVATLLTAAAQRGPHALGKGAECDLGQWQECGSARRAAGRESAALESGRGPETPLRRREPRHSTGKEVSGSGNSETKNHAQSTLRRSPGGEGKSQEDPVRQAAGGRAAPKLPYANAKLLSPPPRHRKIIPTVLHLPFFT